MNLGCFQSRGRPQRGVQCGMGEGGAVAGLCQRGEVLLVKHTGSWEATDSFTPGLGGNFGDYPSSHSPPLVGGHQEVAPV